MAPFYLTRLVKHLSTAQSFCPGRIVTALMTAKAKKLTKAVRPNTSAALVSPGQILVICPDDNCFVRLLLLSFILHTIVYFLQQILATCLESQLFGSSRSLARSICVSRSNMVLYFICEIWYFISYSIRIIVVSEPASAYFDATCYQLLMVF